MKKRMMTTLAIAALGFAIIGCKNKADEAKTGEAEAVAVAEKVSEKYVVDVAESQIEWTGHKPTGSHTGTITLANGELTVDDGTINSGSFTLDMNTITNLDMPADSDGNKNLVGHLKSPDFFNVAEFPNASFEITGIATEEGKNVLSGNLTIKNISHNVSFPVNIAKEGDSMTLSSETFSIDRTKWDIKYKSKSIFSDLGDKFINDDVEIKITVKAKKA